MLSRAQVSELHRAHADALQRILGAELIALDLLRSPTRDATRRLVETVSAAHDPHRAAIATLTTESRALQATTAQAVHDGRAEARKLARGQVENELANVRSELRRRPDLPWAPESVPARARAAPGTRETEDFEAARAGRAAAQRWASAGLAAVLAWRRSGRDAANLVERFGKITAHTDGTLRRIGSFNVTDAYADEQRRSWSATVATPEATTKKIPGGTGPEQGLPLGWARGLFDVWTASLDRKTCPLCMDKDGSMVPRGKDWPGFGRPPVHPFCRCVPMTIFVADAASARRLPGAQLDYAALKEDIKDYFRGAPKTIAGTRHAADFMRDVLEKRPGGRIARASGPVGFARTSPEVQAQRLLSRPRGGYLAQKSTRIYVPGPGSLQPIRWRPGESTGR